MQSVLIAGNQWVVIVNSPEGTEAMFRAEGKYPCRGEFLEKTISDIHKMNSWPSPMLFALVYKFPYIILYL